jgi:hypothetical protein
MNRSDGGTPENPTAALMETSMDGITRSHTDDRGHIQIYVRSKSHAWRVRSRCKTETEPSNRANTGPLNLESCLVCSDDRGCGSRAGHLEALEDTERAR